MKYLSTMKTKIIRNTLLIAAVLFLGTVQAAEPVRATNPTAKRSVLERTLDRALNKHLAYPWASRADMNGDVYVSFVVDSNGDLEVLDCRSTNADLKAYVLRKLARVNVGENSGGIWKTSHLRIAFHPEEKAY